MSFDPKFFEAAVRSSLITFGRSVSRNVFIYCSIMLSRVKLTNANTVRGRPTLKSKVFSESAGP